ncbi:hypothetical protein AVHM3334_03630 [Acidovorax sp. SUPP3334]|nr:hypothetical protein AVHM3334_03630 [Acidovorax sp. SUPP3334]
MVVLERKSAVSVAGHALKACGVGYSDGFLAND